MAVNDPEPSALDHRHPDIARLLVSCADRPGIVAAISSFLFEAGANIVSSDQYSDDPEAGTFFLRTEFHLADLDRRGPALEAEFAKRVGNPLRLDWRISYASARKRVALLA